MLKKIVSVVIAISFVLGLCLVPASTSDAAGDTPIYRVYNPRTGEHLFTADANEAKVLSTERGWKDEGLSWYAPATGTPVYRIFYPGKFHLYTSDANEVKYLTTKAGWKADNKGNPVFYSGGDYEIYRLYHPKTGRHLLTSAKKEYDYLSARDWKGEGVAMRSVLVNNGTASPAPSTPEVQKPAETPVTPETPTETTPVVPVAPTTPPSTNVNNPAYVKGVWISFLEWQEYLKGKNEAAFKSTFEKMCDTVVANNCNTIYVHVRSHNDAVYPSAIYPWSTEMLEGVPSYNPLSIMIDIAHSKGLSFQAWINPYGYRNGEFAGDPALVKPSYIIAGIRELVSYYNIDGIHFDDYFPNYDKSVHNALIREAYDTCHAYGKIFGVSPQGNLSNNRAKGVDIDTWLSVPGYIDYLAPQIYWTDQYGGDGKTTMFSDRLKAWTELNKLGLPMYVGLATYRCGNSYSSDPGWILSDNNLATQIQKANAAGWDGYIHFRYADLVKPNTQKELSNIK